MESKKVGTNDDTIPCPNHCGEEINLKDLNDHLKICALEVVECGWCGLRQSRKHFKDHIILANPETEINHAQQCMQRQYDELSKRCNTLSKQQKEFRENIEKQLNDAIEKFSDDIKIKDDVMQRLSDDVMQRLSDDVMQKLSDDPSVKNQIQQNSNSPIWKTLSFCIGILLIINFMFVLCHHYWLQPQQVVPAVPHHKTMFDQIDNMSVDSCCNEADIWHEELIELKTKYNKITQELHEYSQSNNKLNDYLKDINGTVLVEDFKLELSQHLDLITNLNQSILNEAKSWQECMIKVEEGYAKIDDLRLQMNDQLNMIVRLNSTIINETKQWHKWLGKSFIIKSEIDDLRLQMNDQLNIIVRLNSTIINETKQWHKWLEKSFIIKSEMDDVRSELNSQIFHLNQSMANGAKQWQRQLKEMKGNFTKTTTNLMSEIHELKLNCSNIMDDGKCTILTENGCEVVKKQIHESIELKFLDMQSNNLIFENSELTRTLPVTFKMSNFNEKMKDTEQWYGSPFFVFIEGYLMSLEVLASGYDDGKGTHVSLFLRLMKGPYDDKLQQSGHWPLRGTFTVKILNKFTDNDYYTREMIFSTYYCSTCTKRVTDDGVNDGWGYSQFISHDAIQQSNCNQNLYFNVSYNDTNPLIPCNQTVPVTLNMPNVNEKIKNKEQWYSSPFFAFEEGYQMCLKVYATGYDPGEGTHLSVFIHLMKGPRDDKLQESGHWPLRGTFNIQLLSDHHYHSKNVTFSKYNCNECTKRVIKGDITVGWGVPKFLSLNYLPHDSTKINSLNFKVHYEDNNPPIPCKQTAPVTLKMPNLSEKIKYKEQWYSSPFFAFEEGYQMCLKVYAAGYDAGEGTHLSVFIHLMKGPHDDKLQRSGYFPLRGVFTIKLLNRFNGNQHHSKNMTFSKCNCDECVKRVVQGDMTVGCGIIKFLSVHDYLESNSLDFEILYGDSNPPHPDETAQPS